MKSTRRLVIGVMALFLWLPSSYSADAHEEVSGTNEAVITAQLDVRSPLSVASTQGYQTTYSSRDLKNAVYHGFKNYEQDFSIEYKGDTANLMDELTALIEELFEEDPYLSGTISYIGYGYKGVTNDVVITFNMDYLTNKRQEQFVDDEVSRVLSEIIRPGMSDFQKVKAVNDFIVLTTAYSFDTVASPHSAYAILNEQKGVCQAYALLAYKMLDQLGFDVHYVTGEADGIGHAWNLVKVDGKWYNLDTTWNDPTPDQKAQVHYTYFLITDNQLKQDHMWEQGNFPVATSEEYTFMHDVASAFTLNNVIYYSNAMDDYKLYKLDLQTKEKRKLTNSSAQYITAFNEKVYFSNYSNGAFVTEIGMNGENEKQLNQTSSTDLYIEQPYLYFTTTGGTREKVEITSTVTFDPASYSIWQEKETPDLKKEWLIQLNAPLNEKTVNNQTVYIVDQQGHQLPFIKPVVENQKFIRLQNTGSFSANTRYYIVIERSVKSTNGQALTKGVVVPVTHTTQTQF